MASTPLELALPSQVTWTGAGLRAKTSKRCPEVCPARSTRMSMASARINSAAASSS